MVEVVVVEGIEVDEEEEEVEVEEDVVLAVVVDDVVTDEPALELVLLEVVDDVVEDVVEDVVLVPVPAVADVVEDVVLVPDRLSHGQSQLPDWHTLSAQKPGPVPHWPLKLQKSPHLPAHRRLPCSLPQVPAVL